MIEAKIGWTKENIWEFVKYNSLSRTKTLKTTVVFFCVCYALVLATCLVTFFIMQEMMILLAALVVTVVMALYFVSFILMLRGYAKKIYEMNKDETGKFLINGEGLVLCKNDVPLGSLGWESIKTIMLDEKNAAAYMITNEDALILIEFKNVSDGKTEELKELLESKNVELSKKA